MSWRSPDVVSKSDVAISIHELKRMRCLFNVDNANKADGRRAIQIVDISSLTRRRRCDKRTDYAIVRRIRHGKMADPGKLSTDN